MSNAINWFELPANDFNRAVKFYSELLSSDLQMHENAGFKRAFFPTQDQGVGGCVVYGEGFKPHSEGSLVYLNGGEDLSNFLDKVEPAGGKVVMPKTSIGENGYMAMFLDTEGNRVAFHSMG